MTPKNIQRLRALLAELETEAEALHEAAKAGTLTVDDAVDIGVALVGLEKTAHGALSPIKDIVRQVALDETKGQPGTCRLETQGGSKCQVIVPSPTIKVRGTADMDALKTTLGDRFALFFNTQISYKPAAGFNKLAAYDPQGSRPALDAVDIIDGTPRVSFKREA